MLTHIIPHPRAGIFPYRSRIFFRQTLAVIGATLVGSLVAILLMAALSHQAARAGPPLAEPPISAGLLLQAGRADALFEAPTLKSYMAVEINGQATRVKGLRNPSSSWPEGIYVLPLLERSAVGRPFMTLGQRPI